ncbi:MAG: Rrf2 family transcriptional regulator [Ignavibacteria bacterium]|nr:Rrf2 family transcriptional regulator [Bacteroidota bacterium]MSQ46095.1 Rrf2 family transcriptional regulator [Ignavibacteria bacterium]
MLKLSKKVEYGLIAIRHMALIESITTAKEISDHYKLPFDLLAKVMQKLAKSKIITSHQGIHGGYKLAKSADSISIMDIIQTIEGHIPGIVQCIDEGLEKCSIHQNCTIRNPLHKVQENLESAFNNLKISEIV